MNCRYGAVSGEFMQFELEFLLVITLVFTIAGTIKGIIGIGLPTISIALISQFTDPRTAIALVMIPMLMTNVWQVYRSGKIIETFRQYWVFALILCISIFSAAQFSAEISTHIILTLLGCIIIIYALTGWLKIAPKIPAKYDRYSQVFFGLLSGILGGFTAIWAPPMIMYLTSKNLSKDEFVGATGLLITLGVIPLILGYWQNGLLTSSVAITSSIMIIPALLGYILGEFLRPHLPTKQFYNLVMLLFCTMGVNLIIRGFSA